MLYQGYNATDPDEFQSIRELLLVDWNFYFTKLKPKRAVELLRSIITSLGAEKQAILS